MRLDSATLAARLDDIRRDTNRLGFTMASDPLTGSLLRVLAAAKPGGRLLEIGTGTGVGTAALLAGMDAAARLDTIDNDGAMQEVARRHLGDDARVRFHTEDGAAMLEALPAGVFDLVYADAWPGKFSHLDAALRLVKMGGVYVIDDLLPQPNWPEGHAPKVPVLVADLEARREFVATRLDWASGVMLLVRVSDARR